MQTVNRESNRLTAFEAVFGGAARGLGIVFARCPVTQDRQAMTISPAGPWRRDAA